VGKAGAQCACVYALVFACPCMLQY
jgi:hypothetical protein